jgi:hypothetical protein
MAEASLNKVQDSLRHESLSMTMRDARLSRNYKKKAISLLNKLTAPKAHADASMSQNVRKPGIVKRGVR